MPRNGPLSPTGTATSFQWRGTRTCPCNIDIFVPCYRYSFPWNRAKSEDNICIPVDLFIKRNEVVEIVVRTSLVGRPYLNCHPFNNQPMHATAHVLPQKKGHICERYENKSIIYAGKMDITSPTNLKSIVVYVVPKLANDAFLSPGTRKDPAFRNRAHNITKASR